MKTIRYASASVLCLAAVLWWWQTPQGGVFRHPGNGLGFAQMQEAGPADPHNIPLGRLDRKAVGPNVQGLTTRNESGPDNGTADSMVTSSAPMTPKVSALENPGTPAGTKSGRAGSSGTREKQTVPSGRNNRKPPDFSRAFEVPSNLSGEVLPIFVLELDQDRMTASNPGGELQLTQTEELALKKAGELFFDGLASAPSHGESDPEYEAWWKASQIRSEEMLKALLGWDRYNTLNAEAARRQYNNLPDQPSPSSF